MKLKTVVGWLVVVNVSLLFSYNFAVSMDSLLGTQFSKMWAILCLAWLGVPRSLLARNFPAWFAALQPKATKLSRRDFALLVAGECLGGASTIFLVLGLEAIGGNRLLPASAWFVGCIVAIAGAAMLIGEGAGSDALSHR